MKNILFMIWGIIQVIVILLLCINSTEYKTPVIILSVLNSILLILFHRMVVMPARVISRGFELIGSQDFNNRLVKVGELTSDKFVTLFNTMIDRLRQERQFNLERENFLQLLVEASPMGIMLLDFDGNVSMVNKAFLNLIGEREEKGIIDFPLAGISNKMMRQISKVEHGKSELIRPGDARMLRATHLSFVQSGHNRHFYLLENLTEEVMRAERNAYEKVIRNISHEVNNTMVGVRTILGILKDESHDAEMVEVAESCDRRCGELGEFIAAYAEVVRLPPPEKKSFSLTDMLRDSAPFYKTILPSDIILRAELEEDEIFINADRSQLEQVLINIIKNAVESFTGKHDEENQWIEVRLRREKSDTLLEISNNGVPISEEVAAKLFSPFFTTKRDGKGLGLTLIAEILGNHKAVWSLSSSAEGITTFSIKFPAR